MRVHFAGAELGATRALDDTTEPVWDELVVDGLRLADDARDGDEPTIVLRVFDRDRASEHDPLGNALIPLNAPSPTARRSSARTPCARARAARTPRAPSRSS